MELKELYRTVKRWDIIIVIALVILSFLPFVIFTFIQTKYADGESVSVAVISVDNEEVQRVTLTGNEGVEVFDILSSDSNYNIVEVIDEEIRVKSANCPDQIDVHQGFISKPGETIVCLPHRMIIEIQTMSDEPVSDIIISS
ncbi:NusG domain II-containing protein [Oceanobacillus sp. AG]|uniref:NusG domain II-containing protein n=1 Tax=unclassified Oceanobacillus TaxID=2630292 RepID=UPI0012EB9DD5